MMTKAKADQVLRCLDQFEGLERKNTDEIGWIALKYSCSRARAEKMIKAARNADAAPALSLQLKADRE